MNQKTGTSTKTDASGIYDVVTSDEYKRFVQQVNDRLKEGWELAGGVSISSDSCFRYAQALKKKA